MMVGFVVLLTSSLLVLSVQAFDKDLFVKEMLTLYNDARIVHEVPTVHLNHGISSRASLWAEYLSLSSDRQCLRHSKAGGENLYFYWSTRPITEKQLAIKCADAFYKEIDYYNYNKPGFIYPAAHFTEMIWKSVKEIGISVYEKKYTNSHGGCHVQATPRRPAVGYMVVIQHNPKGNRDSKKQFMLNVLRPVRRLRFA